MRRGDFAGAWAFSDRVLAGRDPARRDDPARPYHERWVWDGSAFDGRTVVVRCYHGLGDTLQFLRFLPALRTRSGPLTLEIQPSLIPLVQGQCAADRIHAFDQRAPLPAGLDVEIMELAHALRSPPTGRPYLRATPMSGFTACTGVCWQAGGWDPARSIPLDTLRQALPQGCVSLQRGASGLPDPLAGTMDVLATARLIAGLRRVVTVDTMVAHLAGALGRPVHLLLKAEADWRWGNAPTTPWYDSVIIHRQARDGDWSAALDSLSAALKAED